MKDKKLSTIFLRCTRVILMVLAFLFPVLFILENQQPAKLSLLGAAAPELPLSIYMLISLLIGLAVGPFVGWYACRRKHRRLQVEK